MSLASESVPQTTTGEPDEISDQAWLQSLNFRKTSPARLRQAASRGDVSAFAKALPAAFDEQCRIGKRERTRLLDALSTLWIFSGSSQNAGSLVSCLFDADLTRDELSGRVEAIIASATEGRPSRDDLVAAHWLLRMGADRLEPQTLLTLYRWTMQASEIWLNEAQRSDTCQVDPQSGCDAFDFFEMLTLNSLCRIGQKGARKIGRQAAKGWRVALDSMTDTDGTPHSRWLRTILPRLAQLTAVSLFADSLNATLWDRASLKRLGDLWNRVASLASPQQFLFHDLEAGQACKLLLTIDEILHLGSPPALVDLLSEWEVQALKSRPSKKRHGKSGKRPSVNHQSDWAEWANLRSDWQEPVDQFAVRYCQEFPEIEVLAAGAPLISGSWSHELTVNGERIPTSSDWSCSCWFLDRQAAFVELQLSNDHPVEVYRQALLLRKESVLIVADSIRLPESAEIEFRRHLQLADCWGHEEDTLSRELALVCDDARVRVIPWSSPQMRLTSSREKTSISRSGLLLRTKQTGQGLFAATVFDWSPDRCDAPIDWQAITVAEDGQILPPDVATGHRLRIGKKQWLVYHSLTKPALPRSALGIHTLSETVYAQLRSSGSVNMFVEVEL